MTLREARQRAWLSVPALARAIGVSRQAVYQWEYGRCGISFAHAQAVCRVLHCTLSDIDWNASSDRSLAAPGRPGLPSAASERG